MSYRKKSSYRSSGCSKSMRSPRRSRTRASSKTTNPYPTSANRLKATPSSLLNLLRETKFPKCSTRQNVASKYEGFCLGEVNYRGQHYLGGKTRGPSRFNKLHPELYKNLTDFIHKKRPNFKYTTIQINKNAQCLPHVDVNNVGPSYIIALGDFTGGELVVEGIQHDIRNKLFKFDGTKGHWTSPFKGERYSIIFFTHTFKPPPYDSRFTVVNKKGLFFDGKLVKRYSEGVSKRRSSGSMRRGSVGLKSNSKNRKKR